MFGLLLCTLRSRNKLAEIEGHALTALGAVEDDGGHDTDALAALQVDCAREILKLCKLILQMLDTSSVAPAGNLDYETSGPSEIFRTSWEGCWDEVPNQSVGRFHTMLLLVITT